jgi:long-chain acyl-CoA synthetase
MKLDASDQRSVEQLGDRIHESTIPGLLLERAREDAHSVALRYKDRGVYWELTWAQYLERVSDVASGLLDLGLERGDRVAIMGDPCLEWLLGDLGALAAGAITFGIYATNSSEETGYQVARTKTRFFIAEDQEQLDKLVDSGDDQSVVEHIVVVDDRTLFLYDDPRIVTFAELERRGRERRERNPDEVEQSILEAEPGDIAVMTFTSGTTGAPKGAMHTHRDALFGMTFPYIWFYEELRSGEHRTVVHLALAHLVERSMSVWLPLFSNCVPHIGEEGEGLRQVLFEVQPTFLHGVPRIWEKIASQITVAVDSSSWLKRRAFRLATRVAGKRMEAVWAGRRPAPHIALLYRLARAGAFQPALFRVGLLRVQGGFTAGAPMPERVQGQWQSWGIPLRDLYGITEGTLVFSQVGRFPAPASPGVPAYRKEVRLAEDGEVLVGGPGLFTAYWEDPESTQAAMPDGYLRTGDVAEETDGRFRIVDRKKDLMITAGGKNITPALVENAVKSSPYISEAILLADGRPFPTCLVELDFDTAAQWARERGISYAGFTDLTEQQQVRDLIEAEIGKANERLARVEQVKKFRIIPKELDPEEGDTTPTRKVKRKHAYDLFGDLIEEMYGSEPVGSARGR